MALRRVDEAMVARGLAATLQEARLMILEGRVFQGAGRVAKPSDREKTTLPLTVRDPRIPYVSRGGFKLARAVESFSLRLAGRVCVDIGASTGGFTDVCLKAGARRVYAIDVGFGQLDYSLRRDPRVTVMERVNARSLRPEQFDELPSFGASDVSFISLEAILPAAFSILSGESPRFVALVKPQFEAPKRDVAPGGVVRDPEVHEGVCRRIRDFAGTLGWHASGFDHSPITGAEGNIEFLMEFAPGSATGVSDEKIHRTVEAANRAFSRPG